jgi:hypothetical protein
MTLILGIAMLAPTSSNTTLPITLRSSRLDKGQKWINMALKYVYVFGEERIPGFRHLYRFCHIPIDNVMLEKLGKWHAPKLSKNWSRADDYDEYFRLQKWVRDKFPGSPPLAVEFALYQEPG